MERSVWWVVCMRSLDSLRRLSAVVGRSAVRTMSTSAPQLFLVTAPDYGDSDVLARRLAVRDAHLEEAKRLQADGILRAVLAPSGRCDY